MFMCFDVFLMLCCGMSIICKVGLYVVLILMLCCFTKKSIFYINV